MTLPAGTRDGPDIPGIDNDAVSAWISSLAIDVHPPLRFSALGNGQSNICVLVTDRENRRWVLRRPPLGRLLASAHDVAREGRVLAALAGTRVPVPGVVAFTADPSVTDAPLLMLEHVDGLVVDAMNVAESISPLLRSHIACGMVAALASIHGVELETTGLSTLASDKPYAARQLKRWTMQWEAARMRERPVVEELADRLRAAIPRQRELTLVHGDYHLKNVIVDPDRGDVHAVLDWELCTLGDPIADLGGMLAYWPEAGEVERAPFPATTLAGFPSRSEVVAAYAQATGRDVSAVGFWRALGLWKIAIIYEGVRRRALDDPRNAARGAMRSASTVDWALAQATAAADQIGI